MRAPKGRALRVCAEHPAAEERVALSLLYGRLGERSHAIGEVFLAVVDGFLVTHGDVYVAVAGELREAACAEAAALFVRGYGLEEAS